MQSIEEKLQAEIASLRKVIEGIVTGDVVLFCEGVNERLEVSVNSK